MLGQVRVLTTKFIMEIEDLINRKIQSLWNKQPKNASEAHVRAEEIARFEKMITKKHTKNGKVN